MDSIFNRRSVRQFQDKPVEKEVLDKVLSAAMQAPTACNDKQWHFYVTEDPELKAKLAAVCPYSGSAKNAPVDIVVTYDENEGAAPEYGQINMALVCENLMLEAASLGLGTVFLGIAPEPERMEYIEKLLELPEGERAFTIIPVGYPKSEPKPHDKADWSRVKHI